MRPTGKLKIAMMAIVILLSCGTADAQRWRWHSRPYRVVTVVTRPDVTVHVGNRFTQKERFRMAMAYLKSHDYLTEEPRLSHGKEICEDDGTVESSGQG